MYIICWDMWNHMKIWGVWHVLLFETFFLIIYSSANFGKETVLSGIGWWEALRSASCFPRFTAICKYEAFRGRMCQSKVVFWILLRLSEVGGQTTVYTFFWFGEQRILWRSRSSRTAWCISWWRSSNRWTCPAGETWFQRMVLWGGKSVHLGTSYKPT